MSNEIKMIDILDQVLDPQYWSLTNQRIKYTGHLYRNSPYESDDSCGNCDGARCDTCQKIIIPAGIECSIQCDKLERMLNELGLDRDVVLFFTYDDSGKMNYKNYRFKWPTDTMLKSKYPEKYKEIYSSLIEKEEKYQAEMKAKAQARANNVNQN